MYTTVPIFLFKACILPICQCETVGMLIESEKMCWNIEASAALTFAGTAGVAYGIKTKQPKELVIALAYFTLMEAIQMFSYPVIDACAFPRNQILTILAYIHVSFQPFIINMVMLYFIPRKRRERIAMYVYIICGIASAFTLLQLYPFSWAGNCDPRVPFCGTILCSSSGVWHLLWQIPLNGLTNAFFPMPFAGLPGYVLAGILLPFLYGSWRANVYHLFFGPTLAWLVTSSINEAAAVWCTFSIALLLSVLGEKPVRKHLRVRGRYAC